MSNAKVQEFRRAIHSRIKVFLAYEKHPGLCDEDANDPGLRGIAWRMIRSGYKFYDLFQSLDKGLDNQGHQELDDADAEALLKPLSTIADLVLCSWRTAGAIVDVDKIYTKRICSQPEIQTSWNKESTFAGWCKTIAQMQAEIDVVCASSNRQYLESVTRLVAKILKAANVARDVAKAETAVETANTSVILALQDGLQPAK